MDIKTTWQITDKFNFNTDYMRIRANILEIYDLAIQLNSYIILKEMPIYTNYAEFPILKMYQNVEYNVDLINKLTFNLDYTKRDFPDFSLENKRIRPWNYIDLNRIENMTYLLYEIIKNYIEEGQVYAILTEDGYNILTEDGFRILKEI